MGHDLQHRGAGRIVVGVDGSEGSYRALAWATDEARRRSTSLLLVGGVVLCCAGAVDAMSTTKGVTTASLLNIVDLPAWSLLAT